MHPTPTELPPTEWAQAMNEFSRRHQGQPTRLVVVSPDLGQHSQAKALPLLGISAEPSENAGETPTITIAAATVQGLHISHEVAHPTHLRVAEWNDGVSGRVEVEAENGFMACLSVGPEEQTLPSGAVLDGNYQRS